MRNETKRNYFEKTKNGECIKLEKNNKTYKIGDITALVPFKEVTSEELLPLRYVIDLEVYDLPKKEKIDENLEELKSYVETLKVKPKMIYIEAYYFRVVWRNNAKEIIWTAVDLKKIFKEFKKYICKIGIEGMKLDERFTLDNGNINEKDVEVNAKYEFNINDFNNETKEVTVIDFIEEISYKGWRSND
ncbi:hypothetical protein [Clostridium gasigenes]|uniref:Uncharacterized protein n=1 Tax=Clostridium gasigenes TaxID=94869 RepID=A0A1H0V4S5_9CLOT|nr:hypothetical protein [Clostridium gasigenes]SDP73096.1 hypothetical protein SAMN04488529_11430 [Clostridium gasigenes]